MLGNDIVLCIVGNKIDLEKDRHVPLQTAEEYAQSVNAKLYHTSAKSNKGIEELFNDLAVRKSSILIKLYDQSNYICFIQVCLKKRPHNPMIPDQVEFQFNPNHLQMQILERLDLVVNVVSYFM